MTTYTLKSPPHPLALINLTFISDCLIPVHERHDAIEALLCQASRANAIDDITGTLLLTSDQFVHTLEGPAATVDALMARITADLRHTNIVIVDRRYVACRTFARWGLSYWGSSVFVGRMVASAQRGDHNDVTRLLELVREFGTGLLRPRP